MKVGFIGLGQIGVGMAANLLKAGHEVVVFNRTGAKNREPLAGTGRASRSGCRGGLSWRRGHHDAGGSSNALRNVVFGSGGVVANLWARRGRHISSSTISVALAEELEAAHAAAGQKFVSAPVFGRPEAAAAGKLFVVAAGASRRPLPYSRLCSTPSGKEPSSFPKPRKRPIWSS